MRYDPNGTHSLKLERIKSGEMKRTNRNFRNMIERSSIAKIVLEIIGVIGVSLIIADGVLTSGSVYPWRNSM